MPIIKRLTGRLVVFKLKLLLDYVPHRRYARGDDFSPTTRARDLMQSRRPVWLPTLIANPDTGNWHSTCYRGRDHPLGCLLRCHRDVLILAVDPLPILNLSSPLNCSRISPV